MKLSHLNHVGVTLAAALSGCAAEQPAPRNDLEHAILSGEPAFRMYVQRVGTTNWPILQVEMEQVGFKPKVSDGCEHYRYDRTLDIMGQRVTAQVFKCPKELSSDLGHTFL